MLGGVFYLIAVPLKKEEEEEEKKPFDFVFFWVNTKIF